MRALSHHLAIGISTQTDHKPEIKIRADPKISHSPTPILLSRTHSVCVIDRLKYLCRITMSGGDKPTASPYEQALDALSSLITKRTRCGPCGDRFDLLFDYVKMLDLEEPISRMKIIHVAGTKGKGSTCTFTESILRNCGFHTGLFTSPHLIDIRERFRLDGIDISEEKFLAYFWWCWDRLKEKTGEDVPMPTLFRFLTLLAFKIFAAEKVDVAIMEVGLGGKFDATNVVQKPTVCGITSLGYDHMEILGHTLTEIAGEKAGILKQGVPAFTVSQPDEAMCVLKNTAANIDVHLQVTIPLDANLMNGLCLGLDGAHQFVNAGLAIALSSTWLERTGHVEIGYAKHTGSLPEQFIKGLATATLQGRSQVEPDRCNDIERPGDLVFFLDGAHSPESMEVCGRWFCQAITEGKPQDNSLNNGPKDSIGSSHERVHEYHEETSKKNSTQILLFNCMSVRDPNLLFPRLKSTCASQGIHFQKAFFVPNMSLYAKVGSHDLSAIDSHVDLSWQLTLQRVWENLSCNEKGGGAKNAEHTCEEGKDDAEHGVINCENSSVFPSLPMAIKWLRDTVKQNQSTRLQVLVAGSLHLVGDVLKLIKK